MGLSARMRAALSAADPIISGFNFGSNDGASAGQTVTHAHFHIIPRREGDAENPRGGVRGVIPEPTELLILVIGELVDTTR